MAHTKIDELINKHLSFEKTSLAFASVEYFAETGNISGELYLRLQAMLEEALAETERMKVGSFFLQKGTEHDQNSSENIVFLSKESGEGTDIDLLEIFNNEM